MAVVATSCYGSDVTGAFREWVDAMRALWAEESTELAGQFLSFACIDARSKPGPGGPPLIMGGHADASLEDAAAQGSGWYDWHAVAR